jgi:heavy metal sensor kinase
VTLTLRARLAAIWTLVFGLLLGVVSVLSYRTLASRLESDVNLRLAELTNGLHGYLHEDGDTFVLSYDADDNEEAAFIHEATRYYQIYGIDEGRLVVQSPGLLPLGVRLTHAEVQAFAREETPLDLTTGSGRLRLSNSEVRGESGRSYLLQVGVSLADLDATLTHYRNLMLWGLPLAIVGAIAVAWWLSGLALRPLTDVAAAARAIDVDTLQHRVPARGARDELDEVASALNGALGRLEQSVGEMRQFSAALAHELRTPLTAMRGEMELALRNKTGGDGALRATLADQIEGIDRLKALIDKLLTLARAESGQIPLAFAPVDLSALACSLVDQLSVVAEARQIALRCEPDSGIIVSGDAGWIERMLLNLIDNAIRFTPAGGDVRVRVAAVHTEAELQVSDTGVGMSEEELAHVFDRFYRADSAPSRASGGSGLGLALVAWIVKQHQGTIAVESSRGHGATFTMRLARSGAPRAAANEHRSG